MRESLVSGASGRSRVLMSSATTSDLSLSNYFYISDGGSATASQNFPVLAGQSNVLGVVWQEINQGNTSIKMIASINGIDGLKTAIYSAVNGAADFAALKAALIAALA